VRRSVRADHETESHGTTFDASFPLLAMMKFSACWTAVIDSSHKLLFGSQNRGALIHKIEVL
jgi:hypothetical protein